MAQEFTPFSQFHNWISDLKEKHDGFGYTIIIDIDDNFKYFEVWESYLKIQIHETSDVKLFKVWEDSDPNLNFEITFFKIFIAFKPMVKILTVNYNSKRKYNFVLNPALEHLNAIKNKGIGSTFIWDGQKWTTVVQTTIDLFAQKLDQLKKENDLRFVIRSDRIVNYNSMKENLFYWLDFLQFEIEVPFEGRPLLKLIKILLAGLSQRNEGYFRDFLIRGLYDPRLFLFIEPFLEYADTTIIFVPHPVSLYGSLPYY